MNRCAYAILAECSDTDPKEVHQIIAACDDYRKIQPLQPFKPHNDYDTDRRRWGATVRRGVGVWQEIAATSHPTLLWRQHSSVR